MAWVLLPLTLPIHPTSFHLFSIHLILIRIFIFINYNINYIVFQDLILIIHFPIIPSIFPIILIQPAADVPPIINFTSLILTYTYLSISASISVLRMQMQSFPFSRIPPPSPVAPLVSSLTGSPCSLPFPSASSCASQRSPSFPQCHLGHGSINVVRPLIFYRCVLSTPNAPFIPHYPSLFPSLVLPTFSHLSPFL
jgi:hypothetical protein